MEVKKFEAPTLAEALRVVKRELGADAVILSTKTNRSGFGLLAKGSVEVTAAVQSEALEKKRVAESKMSASQIDILQRKPAQKSSRAYDILSGSRLERMVDAMNPAESAVSSLSSSDFVSRSGQKTVTAAPAAPISRITQRRYIDISDDDGPAEMASAYSSDRAKIATPTPNPIQQARAQSALRNQSAMASHVSSIGPASTSPAKANGQILPKLLAQLIDSGVDQDLVRDIGDELKLTMVREQVTKEEIARAHLGRLLMARLRVAKPLGERLSNPATPRMIAFIGPTGVGKTTTIAKIAAELVINQHRPVTLATTDTYKIAAVEQLQTYANILKIPLEVCPTVEALANLSANLDSEHVVLIDTAGYGPRDEAKITELRDMLSGVRTETHLCVGAMTRDRDLIETIQRFKNFEPNYLVMTKLDETTSFGGILNVCVKSHLPLSYFTMGQRVPEDMEVATKERVADLLLNISGGV